MLVTLICSLSLSPTPDVLEVGPGQAYVEIFDAVADAVDGDLVLVHPSPVAYGHFGIIGKSVDVVASGPGALVAGQVRVQGLAAGQQVTIADLGIVNPASSSTSDYALTIAYNAGSVRLQKLLVGDVQFANHDVQSIDTNGVRVIDSEDVAFTGCLLAGCEQHCWPDSEFGDHGCNPGYEALEVRDSTVNLESCRVTMRDGGHDHEACRLDGYPGIVCWGSNLTVRGCRLEGGDKGAAYFCSLGGGDGFGGDCILSLSHSSISVLDTVFEPGFGWYLGAAADGEEIAGQFTRTDWSGTAPSIDAPSVVVESSTASFVFEQEPGTRVDLLVSLHAGRAAIPALSGDLLIRAPFLRNRYIAGTTDGAGSLSWTWSTPGLGSIESMRFHFQSAQYDATLGRIVLGPVHVVSILNDSL